MIQLNKWTASNGFYNEKESFMYMQLKRKTGNFNNLYRQYDMFLHMKIRI